MMDFDGAEFKKLFEEAFGRPIETLTVEQARFIVNVGKHIRGRARNNSALCNYLNRNFKHLKFSQEERTGAGGKSYEVTAIAPK